MKALAKLEKARGISMFEAPVPTIKHDEVLIKIKKTAICGTDVHIYNWDEWAQRTIPVPLITGHEFVGEIIELGSNVSHLKIGSRVSGEGHIICGHCRNCRGGREHLCPNTISVGVTRQGCFAEYLAIPARNVFVLPDVISDDVASVLDPLGNAAHTALSFDLIGEDVLITGAGPVGLFAAAIAKYAGARHIVITDVNPHRLALAEKMGVIYAVNAQTTSLHDVMKNLGMTEGFDVGLEMSGNPHAFRDMLDTVRYGARIAMLGFLPGNTQIDWNKIIMKGLILKGIYGREMFETWYKMRSMLEGGLNVSPVITHRFPIDQYQQAFEIMCSGESGKIILEW